MITPARQPVGLTLFHLLRNRKSKANTHITQTPGIRNERAGEWGRPASSDLALDPHPLSLFVCWSARPAARWPLGCFFLICSLVESGSFLSAVWAASPCSSSIIISKMDENLIIIIIQLDWIERNWIILILFHESTGLTAGSGRGSGDRWGRSPAHSLLNWIELNSIQFDSIQSDPIELEFNSMIILERGFGLNANHHYDDHLIQIQRAAPRWAPNANERRWCRKNNNHHSTWFPLPRCASVHRHHHLQATKRLTNGHYTHS